MDCSFVPILHRLQKHSAESVENASTQSDHAAYLHVDRIIQDDVVALLDKEEQEQHKSLVLICGSAGDGKSHMLSYLSHAGQLHTCWTVINDATESDAPSLTACETLAQRLVPFDDAHLMDGNTEKYVVAINEGMLSRFLDSEPGGGFVQLRNYVAEAKLLSTDFVLNVPDASPYFKSISFSNYHPFTLVDNKAHTGFLSALFEKVYRKGDDNPFYREYSSCCSKCNARLFCPVCHNYAFMSDKTVQEHIIRAIVEVSLAERFVITTRAVLNYLYELMVPPEFDINELMDSGPAQLLALCLPLTTPNLMYGSRAGDSLPDRISRYDVMNTPPEEIDEITIRLRASSDAITELLEVVRETPYYQFLSQEVDPRALYNDNDPDNMKQALIRFIVRCGYLEGSISKLVRGFDPMPYLDEYVRLLHRYNVRDTKQLKQMTQLLIPAIRNWNGSYPDEFSWVSSYGDLQLLRKLNIRHRPIGGDCTDGQELAQFSAHIKVRLYLNNLDHGEDVDFDVDYSLYCLLKRMDAGYQPTVLDKSLFTEFSTSFDRLIRQGIMESEVFVVRRASGKQPIAKFWFDSDYEEYHAGMID